MINNITNFVEGKCRTTTTSPGGRCSPTVPGRVEAELREQRTGFTKVFRWPVPDGQTPQPTTVEVAGSFSGWRKFPLTFDGPSRTWQLTLNNIEGNRTHRYVILVDGKPSYDNTCDGLVAPNSPDEGKWSITTPRGTRVMLLFSQTK